MQQQHVEITTFGYGHAPAPEATIVLDLRVHFRDPHVRPELRWLTAEDIEVREAVMGTPGISRLVTATAAAVRAYLAGPTDAPVTVAVGCAGGRHRAATVGMALAYALRDRDVVLVHRDLHRDVIDRPAQAADAAGPGREPADSPADTNADAVAAVRRAALGDDSGPWLTPRGWTGPTGSARG
ncbi:RapZ C-terminal domain-containing protein [Actinomadura atramentaria]|uniref:RapZ C-terminal domain-containing protein n=1 Tax=Actinomadura atramentaria TaxID=1990 RepID=UPI00036513B0|nr:RNase adapter RapZ [Actinomadura atramentaria]